MTRIDEATPSPPPGRPLAIDAPEAQVVRAAEKVASPPNGTA